MKSNTKNTAGAILPIQQDIINPIQEGKYGTLYKLTGPLLIITDCFKGVPRQFDGTTRGSISGLSPGSAGRMRRYLRECLPEYTIMLTLTYPGFYPSNGETVKNHLKRFLQECKRYVARNGGDVERFSAFWFLEFQSRGAPHFHIFLTDQLPKEWVALTWYYIVDSEDERHLRAGTRIETIRAGKSGIMAYASKYAAKHEQKEVPPDYERVGRFWGVTGRRDTTSAATFVEAKPDVAMKCAGASFLLIKTINALLFDGSVNLIKREQGTAIFAVTSNQARSKLLARVCHLQCQSGHFDQLFCDADIDFGESLPEITRDQITLITDKPGVTMMDLLDLASKNRMRTNEGKQKTQEVQASLF